MIYNVQPGKDFATIELTEETKVIFSFSPNLIAVKATSGTVTVALDEGAQSGDDGVRTITEGESTTIKPGYDGAVWINGTGTVDIWAGTSGIEIPLNFKKSAKGGESGGFVFPRVNVNNDIITDGRVWVSKSAQNGGVQPRNENDTLVILNMAQPYEIGMAFKIATLSGARMLYGGRANSFASAPFCEFNYNGKLIYYADSNGSDPWDVTIQPMDNAGWGMLTANKWYFTSFAYDGSGNYTARLTDDFKHWSEASMAGAQQWRFYDFSFGGSVIYNTTAISYDLGNCYLKQNDEMVWGQDLEKFPADNG